MTHLPPVRIALVVIGFILMALAPVVGPIPGPGGLLLFAGGLSLVLKYSGWAKRQYVKFKRKHPKKGHWADWGLRRQSAKRREAVRKAREMEFAEPAGSQTDDVPGSTSALSEPGPGRGLVD
jgi:hypothetical protein